MARLHVAVYWCRCWLTFDELIAHCTHLYRLREVPRILEVRRVEHRFGISDYVYIIIAILSLVKCLVIHILQTENRPWGGGFRDSLSH